MRRPSGVVDTPAAWIYSVADGRIKRADPYKSMARAQDALRAFADRERPG
jgi:hypothetical protein